MNIVYGQQSVILFEKRGATFIGEVLVDAVLATHDDVTINNVFFTPGCELGGARMSRVKSYKLWPEGG